VLWSGRITGHIKLDNPIIPISTRFQERTALEKSSLEEQKNKAQSIIDDINQLHKEYNYIVGELSSYGENTHSPIQDTVELVEQLDKESYQVYIQTLAQQYDDLVEDVNELRDKLYSYVNYEQLMWHEINMQQEPVQVD
jgi:archaellum component FlaC